MSKQEFDPYRKWLGISSKRRPPTHYDILGIDLDEDDPDVIQSAAEQRRSFVEKQRGKGVDEAVTGVIYQLDEAEMTLTNIELRRDYDRRLKLFAKRSRKRQVDANAPRSRVRSQPGATVGEGSGIVKTMAGIVAVLCIAFASMAWFSFQMPWDEPFPENDVAANNQGEQIGSAEPIAANAESSELMVEDSDSASSIASAAPTMTVVEPEIVQPPVEEPIASSPEWIALFDGKSLNGWKGDQRHWRVVDGKLEGELSPGSDEQYLINETTMDDFELRAEFRFLSGNSGINFRSALNPDGKISGPQAEIANQRLATRQIVFGEIHNVRAERTGFEPPNDAVKNSVLRSVSDNDWNTLRIVANGGQISTEVNGIAVDSYSGPAIPNEGFFGIQLHGGMGAHIQFSKIEVQPLGIVAKNSPAAPNKPKVVSDALSFSDWAVEFAPKNVSHRSKRKPFWRVSDGIIESSSHVLSELRTIESYQDFELSFEWRFTPGGKRHANGTGVVVRCDGWNTLGYDPKGIEFDLRSVDSAARDSATGNFIAYDTFIAAPSQRLDGRAVRRISAPPIHSGNRWNTCRIECVGDKLSASINATLINEVTNVPERSGPIILRSQLSAVQFQNIVIKNHVRPDVTQNTVGGEPSNGSENVSPAIPIDFRSLRLAINDSGDCELTVDSKLFEAVGTPAPPKFPHIAKRLSDGRSHTIYDFSKMRRTEEFRGDYLNQRAKSEFDKNVSFDRDSRTLVVTPANRGRYQLPSIKPFFETPFEATYHFPSFVEGLFQFDVRFIQPKTKNIYLLAVSVNGSDSPDPNASAGTIQVMERTTPSAELRQIATFTHLPNTKKTFTFKARPFPRAAVSVVHAGQSPREISKFELIAP